MKITFKIRVKDRVKSKEIGEDAYFEIGETYDINDIDRANLILKNSYGVKAKEEKKIVIEDKPIKTSPKASNKSE